MGDVHVQMNKAPIQRVSYSKNNHCSEYALQGIFILSISNRHNVVGLKGKERDLEIV